MAVPGMVFDEPVATGWCRFEIYGDEDAARKHLHDGRVLLGQLRSIHGVNDRIAHGEGGGFYFMSRTLPGGTELLAMTNDGHDTIRIVGVPHVTSDKPGKKEPNERRERNFAVCGHHRPDDIMPFVWKESLGYSFPQFGDTYYGYASGVSWNGDTATGYLGDDEDEYAFRWTRSDNRTEPLGSASDYGQPTCISGNGALICTDQGWLWQNGWRKLPAIDGPNIPAGGSCAVSYLSPDGHMAAGYINVPNGAGAAVRTPAIWNLAANSYTLLPLDGTGTTQSQLGMAYTQVQETLDGGGNVVATQTTVFHPGHWESDGFHRASRTVTDGSGTTTYSDFTYTENQPVYPADSYTSHTAVTNPTPSERLTTVTRDYFYTVPHPGEIIDMRYDGSIAVGYAGGNLLAPLAALWRRTNPGAAHVLTLIGSANGGACYAQGVTQAQTPVVTGKSQSTGDALWHWWFWTEARGFVAADGGAANAISQGGSQFYAVGRSGSEIDSHGSSAVGRSLPSLADASYQQIDWGTNLTGLSQALDVTLITIIHKDDGSVEFDPPMPGLVALL